MKLSLLLVLPIGLAALPGAAVAQAPVPRISEIPARKSYAPGNLVVLGSNLPLASGVTLDDVPVPILRTGAFRLVAGPLSARDPGFGTVRVLSQGAVATGVAEFVPTLSASQRGLRMEIRLNNGGAGTYTLRFAYGTVAPTVDPLVYGPRLIPANAATLVAGVFADEAPVVLSGVRVPIDVGVIGVPIQLQATCYSADSDVTAHTNLATVPGFGRPRGP
jgi:hypothetical protein